MSSLLGSRNTKASPMSHLHRDINRRVRRAGHCVASVAVATGAYLTFNCMLVLNEEMSETRASDSGLPHLRLLALMWDLANGGLGLVGQATPN